MSRSDGEAHRDANANEQEETEWAHFRATAHASMSCRLAHAPCDSDLRQTHQQTHTHPSPQLRPPPRSLDPTALPALSPSAMAALPVVCELLTVRQGRVHATGIANDACSLQNYTRAHACLLRMDDQTDATVGIVRQALQTADGGSTGPVWLCSSTAAAPAVSSALAALPAVCVAFPLAAAGLASADAQTEARRVAAWSSQQRLASRVVLQLPLALDGEVAALTSECVHALEKLAGAWLVQADAAASRSPPLHALLQSLLAHSSLPVLLVAPLLPFASAALSPATAAPSWTAGAFRWMDSLATLPSLHKLHVAFARPEGGADGECLLDLPLLSQHWTAMRKREQFRAANKLEQETAAVRSRPSPPSSTYGAAAAAVSGVVAPPVAAAPAHFYRAAFTPTTMFYRLAMSVDEQPTRRRLRRVRSLFLFQARAAFFVRCSYSFLCMCACACELIVRVYAVASIQPFRSAIFFVTHCCRTAFALFSAPSVCPSAPSSCCIGIPTVARPSSARAAR